MNIALKEIRFGIKPFVFWILGLAFLVVAGMTKYTGIQGGLDLNKILDKFPRIILAVMGMGDGVDFKTLGGYYSVLMFYVFICVILYGVYLGSSAVNRELIDKTQEFIFTKPRTRSYILTRKLMVGAGFLVLFCLMNIPFSLMGIAITKSEGADVGFIYRYTLALIFVGLLFFAIGAIWSAALKRPEKGATVANLIFMVCFIAGIVYDMSDKASFLKNISPLRFFETKDLLAGTLDPFYIARCLIATGILLFFTLKIFEKRDMPS